MNHDLNPSDRRKFPRAEIITQERILHVAPRQQFIKEVGVTKNISASGLCIRSSNNYDQDALIFVYLNDDVLSDLKVNRAGVMKSGNYFLARVIWCKPSKNESDPFFEVGLAFLERSEGTIESIDLFTRLVNHFTADELAKP